MMNRIIAGILSAVIVFSSLTPAVNATESVVVSQEETTDQEVAEEEIIEEEKKEDKIESEITEPVEENEIQEEQIVETTIIEEVVEEEQTTQTLNTAAPIDEGERAVSYEGTLGDNLTWVLYDDGELVISGVGEMPSEITSHTNYPWYNKSTIVSVTIEEGVTTVGEEAFHWMYDEIKTVKLPKSLQIIKDEAFYNCGIERIELGENLASIGYHAFWDCGNLEEVIYEGTWKEWEAVTESSDKETGIEDSVVKTEYGFTYNQNEDNTIIITGADEGGIGGIVQIPEKIDGYTVTAIGEKAFANNLSIKVLDISSSVKTIKKQAFYDAALKKLTLHEGLESVEDYAFYSAIGHWSGSQSWNMDGLVLPDGLMTIGKYAFSDSNITYKEEILVPDTVTSIGENAFDDSDYITFKGSAQQWIDIYNTDTSKYLPTEHVTFQRDGRGFIKEINDDKSVSYELLFWSDATGNVVVPSEFRDLPVTKINYLTFKGNKNIKSVVIPECVDDIGYALFSGCSNLEAVDINAPIYSLPDSMFYDCVNLTTVNLPHTLICIGSNVFYQCIGLEDVYYDSSFNWKNMEIDSGNAALDDAEIHFVHDWGYEIDTYNYVKRIYITGKSDVTETLEIPGDFHGIPVKGIGDRYSHDDNPPGIFQDNKTIKKVIIPDSVIGIYYNTFRGCSNLEEIKFSENLEYIGEYAFAGCTSLKSIYIPKDLELSHHTFEGCTGLESIAFASEYDNGFYCHLFAGCTNVKEITMPNENFSIWSGCESCDMNSATWEDKAASVFEDVPRNAKVKVAKNSNPYYRMVELGFTNLSVAIVLQNITLPSTVSVELGKEETLSVTKDPTNANDPLNLVWTSADEFIATVDEKGAITGKSLGSTLITVKDLKSGKTARTTVQVVLPARSKITVKTDPVIDTIGLQKGQFVTMQIFATGLDTDEPLEPALFKFTSSDNTIATVDENGVITSVYNGTKSLNVKITAALKNDSAARKVYLSVKTIPVQVETLEYYLSEEFEAIGDTYVVPKSKVKDADYQIQVYTQPLSVDEDLLTPTLKWTTSNSKVATVSKDGLITVKKNADGIAKITATVNDLKKASVSFEIDVRDYSPRLAANTVTLNTNTFDEAQVQMYPVYGTDITAVRLEGNDAFDANYISKDGIHTLNVVADDVVKNGTYKLTLVSTIEGIGEYSQAFNVKVANSVPAITVKQKAPFNLFYSDNEAIVSVAAKNAVISNVELSDTETFKGEFNEDTQELVISYDNKDSILDKKATITVTLKDYRNPITKTFNINAKETKPTLAVSRKSTSLSALSTNGVPLQITNKALNRAIDWDTDHCDVTVADASVDYVTTIHEGTDLTIQPILDENKFANGKTSHSAKLEIRGENWLKPIVVTHTISIVTKNPTIKASQSTLTLNSLFGNTVETTIVPSLSNCPEPYSYEIKATKDTDDYEKIKLEANGWNLKVSFENTDDLPAKGNYKYDVLAQIDGVEEPVKTTVTVKVAESKPKVTLEKTSVTLNKMIADQIDFAAKITAGYEITDMVISEAVGNVLNKDQLAVTFKPETGRIYVEILDKNVENKTYKYQLTPTVKMDGIEKEVELNPLVLSVKIYGNNASISVAGKGSIDLVTRDTGIIYTITGGKNFNYHVNDVCVEETKLVGNDAELFEIEVLEANAKGQPQIMVKAKESVDFSTAVTYKYKLAVKINYLEKEVESAEFKIKVKQSALSLKAQGDLTVYQSVKNGKISIEVVKPVDAKVKEMQILETKATTVPKDALSYELEKKADGSYVLNYQVINPEKLKANAGYKLSLAVTPEGNALNKAAQNFTITLKVKR